MRCAQTTTPEFYDDDLPLLMLGSQSPTALYDDELSNVNLYGLLQACGCPSSHDSKDNQQLKRSARNAMNLLKFLVCDFVDRVNGRPVPLETDPKTGQKELNGFAHALCCCTLPQLALMKAHLHLTGEGDARGGAKEDCCQVLVLLITRHLAEDGETPQPLSIDQLLPTPTARKAFDTWLMQNASKAVQRAVKKAKADATGKGGSGGNNDKAGGKAGGGGGKGKVAFDDGGDEDVLGGFSKKKGGKKGGGGGGPGGSQQDRAAAANKQAQGRQLEEMGLSLYQRKDKAGGGGPNGGGADGAPTKWADSTLADSKVDDMIHTAEREKQQTAKERRRLEEEKRRLASRDPLQLRGKDFDLTRVQEHRVDLLQQAIADVEEAMTEEGIPIQAAGSSSSKKGRKNEGLDHIVSLQAQRDALEKILEGRGMENNDDVGVSVDDVNADGVEDLSLLPSDDNFDPLLFLTLVHRNASFEQLQKSIAKLDNKTDNQVQRLQNLVRDNFELFVRCADGIELFNLEGGPKAATGKDKGGKDGGPGVKERLDKLEALSESSSYQAKKSFKPLLDNTNEVRKVQSALAVLQRIGPLLQAPTLMRQHIENGRYAAAVKAYRRVLVIDDDNKIEILRHIKAKATEAAREARRDLEATIADPNTPVTNLLDGIRDLNELIDLDVPKDINSDNDADEGVFAVGDLSINVRNHTPALACLLLQSAHFSAAVEKLLKQAETSTQKIYNGETVSFDEGGGGAGGSEDASAAPSQEGSDKGGDSSKSRRDAGNRWKYDILEARVVATKRAVAVAKNWLPRLLRIGVAAREAERRLSQRKRRPQYKSTQDGKNVHITSFEIFVTTLTPAVTHLVEHATFCALGCSNSNNGEELKMTFGVEAERRLQSLLRAPLPPAQSAKCASELADVWEVVHSIAASSETLRPEDDELEGRKFNRRLLEEPMAECVALAEDAVVTVERRRCIYAFDVCARSCAQRASGSGSFDGDALLSCVQKLSEELTRAEDCANEIEKGCELVVRRCCEGLASYVRDRGDAARLRAVAECAEALNGRIVDVVREVAYLTNGQCESVEEALAEDIMALEATMFDEFLDNICRHVAGCTKLGSMSFDRDGSDNGVPGGAETSPPPTPFPAYLSACLLAIVRCRAQVDRALGDTTIRRSQGITYQYLAMATAADGVVAGICYELNERMSLMSRPQADRFANELQFLMNTLRKYLSDDMLSVAENCKRMLFAKAGHKKGGDGPDGLMMIEELERLGRVYVLCLGE